MDSIYGLEKLPSQMGKMFCKEKKRNPFVHQEYFSTNQAGWEFVCVRKPEMDLIDGLETKDYIVAPVGTAQSAVAPLFIRNNPVLPSESQILLLKTPKRIEHCYKQSSCKIWKKTKM